ncbi:hypothetical protein K3175_05635 [Qipengyuania sp. GH1]|uniref:hypothetical protein n=1 Tax=Qipengyuania aestuarii TaxID=2867241 RepID=UPI001C8685DF|nr:hypothetical protein [Qipengyuania aestuarii]MBX7535134.1 hypothetical protein [Qipengyuania aestuarii]
MHFGFNGRFPVTELDNTAHAVSLLLQDEKLDEISDLTISFLGWRKGERTQIVDQKGFIQLYKLQWNDVIEHFGTGRLKLNLPTGWVIRDRPQDLEWSPLAVMAGRDD